MWQLKSRKILPSVANSIHQLKVSLMLIIAVAEVARQNRRRGKRYEQGSLEGMEVGGLSAKNNGSLPLSIRGNAAVVHRSSVGQRLVALVAREPYPAFVCGRMIGLSR